jgi:hypothetical protein
MELVDIEGLAAKAAAACEAEIAMSGDDPKRRQDGLHAAVAPLANRDFTPIDRDVAAHLRGVINQSGFLADSLRSLIEESRHLPKNDPIMDQRIRHCSQRLLVVLNEILRKTGSA